MFGHRGFQPVIDAIIRLAERAAKEPRELTSADTMADARSRDARRRRSRPSRGLQDHRKQATATPPSIAVKAKVKAAAVPGRRRGRLYRSEAVGHVFQDLQAKIVRWNILDTGSRIDGRDLKTVRPIVAEVGVLPRTHGSALFTRGETQALVVATLGTGEDEQYIDSLDRHLQGALPAALQLPALLGRRDRPHGFARPARNRSRQARLARHPSDAAEPGGIPLHAARGLRDHRVERLVLDGDGLRHLAGADGCRRAAANGRSPASPWA